MDLFQRFVNDGNRIEAAKGGVSLLSGGVCSTVVDFKAAEEWLEDRYDVPTPRRLREAGWLPVPFKAKWRKNGSDSYLLSTLGQMETARDTVTEEGLRALGVVNYGWRNPTGCDFRFLDSTDGWRIFVTGTGTALYPPTMRLSVIKTWLEKLL